MDQRPNSSPGKQEAVRVGNLIVLAQHDQQALKQQKQSFLAQGYRASETEHFIVCQKRPSSYQTVLIHTFRQAEVDADLICFIKKELSSFDIIPTAKEFGAALFAVLASTFPSPRDQRTIWQQFCLNTLVKLRDHIAHPLTTPSQVSYIAPFAMIYRRIFDLYVGQSFLDVGCSFGFFPVLMAERISNICIMGCDNNPDALRFSTDVAEMTGVRHITFSLQDVLSASILRLGTFDTVTAIHLLEHLPETQLPQALEHLLKLARHRLIVAVPYEQQATSAYGHQQIFSRGKLEKWGQWCIDALSSAAAYRCEDVAGGLLVVDRLAQEE